MDRIFKYDKQQGTTDAWHHKTEVLPFISLDTCFLSRWDYVSRSIKDADSGELLPWKYLVCSDVPSLKVGAPYNPDSFTPVTNAAFLDMVRASIGGTDHKVVSVGSVRNRGRVFVSIELVGMEKFEAAGRKFGAFLNFGHGNDKSSVIWVNTGNVCTVCDNTFSMNLFQVVQKNEGSQTEDRHGLRVCQRHTKNVELKLPEIATLIDKAVGVQAEFAKALNELQAIPCSKSLATDMFAGFVGRTVPIIKPEDIDETHKQAGLSGRARNTVNRLVELFETGKGNNGRDMSDTFGAVTDFYSHESSGGNDPFKQVLSSDYGAGLEAKQLFWNRVKDYEGREALITRGQTLLAATV